MTDIIRGNYYDIQYDGKDTMQIKGLKTERSAQYPCNPALFSRLREYSKKEFDTFIEVLLGLD